MSKEFLIGNGYVFEEKDVLVTIRTLDTEYQTMIVTEILKNLVSKVKEAKADPDKREELLLILEALEGVSKGASLAYSLVKI